MNIEKTANRIFYIALTVELLLLLIDKSAFTNPYEGRLFQLTFLLFAVKILLTPYTRREWLVIVLFGGLGIISYLMTGRNEILRITALVAACKNMNMKVVFAYMFKVVTGGCLLLMVLSLTGILGTVKITGIFRGNEIETRYCLGLGHPNALHCMFFMLVLLWLYLYEKRMKVCYIVILLLGNVGMFLLTDSKTGAMAVFFAVLCTVILKYVRKLQNSGWVYGLVTAELAGCVGVAWIAAKYSRLLPYNENLRKLDRLLSDRIVNLYYDSAVHAGTLKTWTWWGVPENEYYFDLGWVRLFYWYGIIPACIFVLVLILLIFQLKRSRDYMGLVVLASLFLYTLVEAHIISVYIARDYTLFLLGMYWCNMFYADKGKEGFLWQIPRLLFGKESE